MRTIAYRVLCIAAAMVLPGLPALAADPAARAYTACVEGSWPDIDDAATRSLNCSKALQSGRLKPEEVALARLTRGMARYALGDKLIAGDDYREALAHYDQAIDPRNPAAMDLYRRGASLGGLGQTEKALADFSRAIEADPRKVRAYLDRGVLLASRTRAYSRAIDDFSRVLELEPSSANALIARGSAYSELAQYGRALADLDKAIALPAATSDAYTQRGVVYSRQGNVGAALADFSTAIQINRENVAALIYRAGLYATQQRYDLATKDLDAAIAIRRDNASAYYVRGFAQYAQGQYEQALADYDLAIAFDPNLASAYNNRCLTRAILGKDLVRALDDCDAALKLSPVNLDVRATRAFVFLKLGDPQLALNEYNLLLDTDPNRPIALYGRGIALAAAGKNEEGQREKAAALALDPAVAESFKKYGLQ